MMNSDEKLKKIISIVDSCKTYEQVNSCFSFIERDEFFVTESLRDNVLYRRIILNKLRNKIYELRVLELHEKCNNLKTKI